MELLLAAVILGLAQVVRGVAGFGSALVAVPGLTLLWGPREAVALVVVCETVAGFLLVADVWRRVDWRLVAVVCLPAPLFQWLASGVLVQGPERLVTAVVGAVVLVFGLSVLYEPVSPDGGDLTDLPPGRWQIWLEGLLAGVGVGVLGGLVGAPGPALAAFLRRHFEPMTFRAYAIVIFCLTDAVLLALLLARGAGGPELALRSTVALPATLLGAAAGMRLAGRLDRRSFGRFIGLLLTAAGGGLLAG